MTPYAILMIRPVDTDDAIRARFHALARGCHPDVVLPDGDQERLTADWHRYADAYSLVKTAALRAAWERSEALLAGRCWPCRGVGVVGGALKAATVCPACRGEGRVRS
jgi:DnaJ-class molecular chaperone